MKVLVLAVLVACGAAAASAAGVVDAAKAAKAKRKKSTTRVITNADVKKSKGTVVETAAKQKPADAEPAPSLVERQAAMRKARTAYDANLAAAVAEVAALEKELASIEQQYYEENDLDRRDTELVRRFGVTKKKLDSARAVLAELTPP